MYYSTLLLIYITLTTLSIVVMGKKNYTIYFN